MTEIFRYPADHDSLEGAFDAARDCARYQGVDVMVLDQSTDETWSVTPLGLVIPLGDSRDPQYLYPF